MNPFAFHGVDLTESGKQLVGSCPFCEKEGHFFVSQETLQWDCKSCGESGNVYTFLDLLHKYYLSETTEEQYAQLASIRKGISARTLRKYQVAWDSRLDRWIVPIRNAKKRLCNLRAWINGQLYNTPDPCKASLFRATDWKEDGPIYICEGEWDAMALAQLHKKIEETGTILAVPGANVFKESWCKQFAGRDVYLLYDNDADRTDKRGRVYNPGRDGMERAAGILLDAPHPPNSVHVLDWPATYPKGTDIRDFCYQSRKAPRKAWDRLVNHVVVHQGKKVLQRNTFEEVLQDFRDEGILLTQEFVDGLATALATVFSVRLEGNPLWMFLVGPPGSGKSLILDCFQTATAQAECISKLSAKTLISGWKSKDGSDASLLPRLHNRTMIVKDYTTILSMPSSMQEELYGILRDAYDGTSKIIYGTKEERAYDRLRFSFLAGVTKEIYGDKRANLGERFLRIEIVGKDYNPEQQILAAMEGEESGEKVAASDKLRASVLGFLQREIDPAAVPKTPDWMKTKILALSQLVAYLRAEVKRDKHEGLLYRPTPEIGTRVATQLVKLARCLAIVFGEEEISLNVYRIVRKVALTSAIGFNLEVVEAMYSRPEGITAKTLCSLLQLSKSSIQRRLDDLQELRIVEYQPVPNNSGYRGRNTNLWYLSEDVRRLMKVIHSDQTGPPRKQAVKKKKKKRIRSE